jgi:acyl carrier protein phosphodiesterase
VRQCIDLLKPGYGRYSGIVTDVFFDHFLAANWNEYSVYTLRQFAKHAHAVFLANFLLLPFRVKQFLPFLIQHKRLESYANYENLFEVLEIMSRRTSLPSNSEWAMSLLRAEYDQFAELFKNFFAEMIEYVESDFAIRISKPEVRV